VSGSTASPEFPKHSYEHHANRLTKNLNPFFSRHHQCFLTEINSDGTAITNSAVFGATRWIWLWSGAGSGGNIFVVAPHLNEFPVTTNNLFGFLRTTDSGGTMCSCSRSAIISRFALFRYLGGSANDFATPSPWTRMAMPMSLAPRPRRIFDAQCPPNRAQWQNDAFLAKITLTVLPPVITVSPTNQTAGVNSKCEL